MFILMRYVEDELEGAMSLVGTFDDRDSAKCRMRSEYIQTKTRYMAEHPCDSWEWAEIFDDSAQLKVEGMPLCWTWQIFDDGKCRFSSDF